VAYSRRPLLPCALLLALATTACGLTGPSAQRKPTTNVPPLPKSSVSATPSASGSGTPAPGSSASAANGTPKPGTSASAGAGTPKPGTSGKPSSSPKRPVTDLKVAMTLAKTCLMPGQSQTVDVTVSMGSVAVLIDTLYEDKKDGQTHGGFKIDGHADSKGHFSYTFTVLPGTPKGGATVFVRAGNKDHRGAAEKAFIVGTVC
jgi:hypothetical protein